MPPNLPDLITTDGLAEALGCEPETVQQQALAGVLPGVKFGRGWVFPREALLQALNQQAREEAAVRLAQTAPAAVAQTARGGRSRRRDLPELPALPPKS